MDVRAAEQTYLNKPDILFQCAVTGLRRKQAMYTGDRSHPALRALDSVVNRGLTYPGWQNDVRKYEHALEEHIAKEEAEYGKLEDLAASIVNTGI